jgi:hypothetical protein
MKNPLTPKLFGRVFLVAAIGAIAVACVTYFANLYVNSWHFAALAHKPAWVDIFMAWEYMCMGHLRSWGFGYPQSMGIFYLLTSIANALMAFIYLVVPGFIWQLFRCYEHDHKIVA